MVSDSGASRPREIPLEILYLFLQEILNKETVIKRNDRTVLLGKELDFYIPDKKYAFEIDGLYWHSEFAGGINKN